MSFDFIINISTFCMTIKEVLNDSFVMKDFEDRISWVFYSFKDKEHLILNIHRGVSNLIPMNIFIIIIIGHGIFTFFIRCYSFHCFVSLHGLDTYFIGEISDDVNFIGVELRYLFFEVCVIVFIAFGHFNIFRIKIIPVCLDVDVMIDDRDNTVYFHCRIGVSFEDSVIEGDINVLSLVFVSYLGSFDEGFIVDNNLMKDNFRDINDIMSFIYLFYESIFTVD